MHRIIHVCVSGGVLAVLLVLLSISGSAHERRAIADGRYQVVIGFIEEPAFAGEKNGLVLRVSEIAQATPTAREEAEGAPVEGLEATLQAEVIFADQSMELPLSAAFGEPGAYESVFFPMEPGDYTFRIFGTIGDAEIDESFTSSPEGFDSVQSREPFEFPKPAS
jgi:hypothetical protein